MVCSQTQRHELQVASKLLPGGDTILSAERRSIKYWRGHDDQRINWKSISLVDYAGEYSGGRCE